MTARNLSFTVTGPKNRQLGSAIRTAIANNAHAFLNPPIANLGHRGIAKAAQQVPQWLDRSSEPSRDLPLAAMLMERGGTGGSLFRAMYRDFLAECAEIVDDDDLRAGHQLYAEIAPRWTEVSHCLAAAGETGDPSHLARAAAILTELATEERRAMEILRKSGQ